jgi:hypothetical protein
MGESGKNESDVSACISIDNGVALLRGGREGRRKDESSLDPLLPSVSGKPKRLAGFSRDQKGCWLYLERTKGMSAGSSACVDDLPRLPVVDRV